MIFSLRPLLLLLRKNKFGSQTGELMTVCFLIFGEIYFSTNARRINKAYADFSEMRKPSDNDV
jgi:hypothetical protein